MMIRCDIEPTAKARPKTVFRNGRVWTFTPKKTVDAEDLILLSAKQAGLQPFQPHIPLKLTATFFRSKSKHITKAEFLPVRKPDADNFIKTLCDSLSPEIIPDDAQITELHIKKVWTDKETGYLEYELEEIKPLSQGNTQVLEVRVDLEKSIIEPRT